LAQPRNHKKDKKQFAAFCSSANRLLPKIHFREVLNRGGQYTKFYGQNYLFSRSFSMKELNFEQMAALEGGGTHCPGGRMENMSLQQLLALHYDYIGGECVIRNSRNQIVC
jgi:hypothetical protein